MKHFIITILLFAIGMTTVTEAQNRHIIRDHYEFQESVKINAGYEFLDPYHGARIGTSNLLFEGATLKGNVIEVTQPGIDFIIGMGSVQVGGDTIPYGVIAASDSLSSGEIGFGSNSVTIGLVDEYDEPLSTIIVNEREVRVEDALLINPSGTEIERDLFLIAGQSAGTGAMWFNTDSNKLQVYDGSEWINLH